MTANFFQRHTGSALTIALLTFPAPMLAQSPNFSSLPCTQRVTALLDFWAKEKKKFGRTLCESARLDVTIQRDLNSTALACPNDLTTVPSALADYESTMNRVCSAKTNAPSSPVVANNCPTTVLNPAGVATSVLDPIKSEGSAQRALQTARDQLRYITDQGSCDSFANRQECESTKKSWRDIVAALECHANAERTGVSNSGGAQPSASVSISTSASQKKSTVEDFLNFGDKSASTPSSSKRGASVAAGSSAGGAGKTGAMGFLPFGEDSGGGDSFPTPYCKFTQDPSERHDQGRRGCVFDVIWVCDDRNNADPKRAWKREATGSRGCGAIRSLDAIERDRMQLKRLSKEMNRD